MESKGKYSVKKWIEELQKKGATIFRLTDVIEAFPELKSDTIRRSLTRQTQKRKVCSVWNGVYVIIPIEYQNKGIVPVVFYIDQLMSFLGRDYSLTQKFYCAFLPIGETMQNNAERI